MPDSIADRLLDVSPHRLKSVLTHLGVTQAHVARLIGRGDLYVWKRLSGFKPFSPAEEAAIADLVQKAAAMQEAVNA